MLTATDQAYARYWDRYLLWMAYCLLVLGGIGVIGLVLILVKLQLIADRVGMLVVK